MNEARRKQIQQALALIEQAKGLLEVVLAQEQEDFDNMPEDLRNDETGQRAEDTIDALERAATCCDGTVSAVCSEVFGPAKGTIQTLPLLDLAYDQNFLHGKCRRDDNCCAGPTHFLLAAPLRKTRLFDFAGPTRRATDCRRRGRRRRIVFHPGGP